MIKRNKSIYKKNILLKKTSKIIILSNKKEINLQGKIDNLINQLIDKIINKYLKKEFFNNKDNENFLLNLKDKSIFIISKKIKQEVLLNNFKNYKKLCKFLVNIFENVIEYIYKNCIKNKMKIILKYLKKLNLIINDDIQNIKKYIINLQKIRFINNVENCFEEIIKCDIIKLFPIIQLIILNRYSKMLFLFNVYQKPIYLLKKSKRIFKSIKKYDDEKIKIYILLTELYFYLGNYKKSLSYCKRILENSWYLSLKKYELKSYKLLSKIYFHLNDLEASEYYNNKFIYGEFENDSSKIRKIGLNSLNNRINKYKKKFNYGEANKNLELEKFSISSSDNESHQNSYLNLRNKNSEFKNKIKYNYMNQKKKNSKLFFQHLSHNRSLINIIGKDFSLNNHKYYNDNNYIKIDKTKVNKVNKIIEKFCYYLNLFEYINNNLLLI